jgi:phenylalanyl-tRNA synthetase beta chain
MVGYDSIAPQAPATALTPPPDDEERVYHRAVRSLLAARGFTEVHNYSFLSDEQAAALGFDPAAHVRVANPIAADQNLMRLSLLPGIYRNILDNARHFESFRLFEIGREIHMRDRREDGAAGLGELKRVAECLMHGAEVRPAAARPFEHPARAAEVLWRERVVGRLFEFHPSKVTGRAAVLDLDLRLVQSLRPREKGYQPIRRFPSSAFDLSVLAAMRELVGDLQKRLVEAAGPLLEAIEYQRQYSGPPIPEGRQSVSFRLTVAAGDHTLSIEEIGAIRSRIIAEMERQGYELRV